jgi:hypothetical protein
MPDRRHGLRPRLPFAPFEALRCFEAAGLFAALGLLASAFTACSEAPDAAANLRGRGPLVSPYADITHCATARYDGPETPLYSNRPYHTQAPVESVRGHVFCRGERHGTNVWIIDVSHATRLVAFGNADFGLEDRDWTASDESVRVEAAGIPFDRVYTRHVEPGRYVIRQGFSSSAPLVFWDDAAVAPAR